MPSSRYQLISPEVTCDRAQEEGITLPSIRPQTAVGYRKKSSKRTNNRPKTTPPGGKVKIVTTDLTKSESLEEDVPALSSEKQKSAGLTQKVGNKSGRYLNSSYGLTERDDGNFKVKTLNGRALSYHNFRNEITVSTESNIFYRQGTNTGHKSKECDSRDNGSRKNRGSSYFRNKGNNRGDQGQSTDKADDISIMKEGWSVTELPDDSLSGNDENDILHSWTKPRDEDKNDIVTEVAKTFEQQDLSEENEPRDDDRAVSDWINGPQVESDEYDTELEDDFPPGEELPIDASGCYIYADRCKKAGIIPVSYLIRNMGEGNFRMRHHYLGPEGTKPLAHALKHNTVCEEIDISDNYVDQEGAAALAHMMKENMFVVSLDVSNNFIRSDGAKAFSEMLNENTTLKTLSLKGNQLIDADAWQVAEALKNNMSLNSLDLSYNHFGELGGINLAAGLKLNIGLADLDLSWNCIRQKGGVAIAKALMKNSSLETMDLSWNGLGEVGAAAFGAMLRVNKTLKVLDISNNRINAAAAKLLAPGIAKNKGLETLLLGANPLGEIGVEAIVKAVCRQPSLKLLGLEGCMDCKMAPDAVNQIKELEASRDIMIMYTSSSAQHSKINTTVLAVFERFLTENEDRMEDIFIQMDKDGSGDISLGELKMGLKDFGLRLTSKQLDMLLNELDADGSGTIEYDELMGGSAMVKKEREKMDRQAADAQMYARDSSLTISKSSIQSPKPQTQSQTSSRP